ncbi:hypothetical protein [Methylobacterium brachiatum]|uniref:hypothetical protein n=1 Tax=Methylobacterium brachiatum TaxID=269660 RepID=UPI0008E005FB|nr:hypothetical protein [Methylobacterium brachiatum]SFJ67819.1 hypothetical protein SAMN02799642_05140 [Methylobacterium brachiatum]
MSLRRDQPALDLIGAVLDAILAFSGAESLAAAGADLDAAVGDLRSDAQGLLRQAALFTPLARCFSLAQQTGMTVDTMERLRATIAGLAAADARSALIQSRSQMFCCIQEARITAATTYTSRNEVDRVLGLVAAAFDISQSAAADAGDAAGYRALVGLRAAMVRDLTDRSRPLPKLVTYSFGRVRSSLTLAQRLYGDAGRADEIIAENEIVHPLFAPRAGRALSA